MRQGGGQVNPDPPAPESSLAPQRRRVRWWRVVLLTLVMPLAVGVFGWLDPTDAWMGVWVMPGVIAVTTALAWERGDIPRWARARVLAWTIGYGVLCSVAAPVGAWLAR